MTTFTAYKVPAGYQMTNRFGYTARAAEVDLYSVCDEFGYPIRTHDGFAVFHTMQQAQWCAELMTGAFHMGKLEQQKILREALGIPEQED